MKNDVKNAASGIMKTTQQVGSVPSARYRHRLWRCVLVARFNHVTRSLLGNYIKSHTIKRLGGSGKTYFTRINLLRVRGYFATETANFTFLFRRFINQHRKCCQLLALLCYFTDSFIVFPSENNIV